MICMERYKKREDDERRIISEIDMEREDECGICMEMNTMIVLPKCNHSMCLKCYRDWYSLLNFCSIFSMIILSQFNTWYLHCWKILANELLWRTCFVDRRHSRSQSCPFCLDSLKRVNSTDLWIYTDSRDIIDSSTMTKENLRRLLMYVDKLPIVIPCAIFESYDSHTRWG